VWLSKTEKILLMAFYQCRKSCGNAAASLAKFLGVKFVRFGGGKFGRLGRNLAKFWLHFGKFERNLDKRD